MSNNSVLVTPAGSGTAMQTFQNTVGSTAVNSEAVTLVRSSDNSEVGSSTQPLYVQGNINQTESTPGYEAITDGTHGPAAVKAASTAAVAGDPALVVAVSPNNSVAVTGTFYQTTQPVSGTVTANAGTGNFNENLAQVGGNTVSTAATGTQLVGLADGSGNTLTSNSSTFSGKHALDVNLLGSDGTAFGTAGVVDHNTKNIGGNAVSTAASGVQKVGIVGNAGAAMDAAGQNASSPANELLVAGQYNTSPTTITSGNVSPLQLDASGNLKVNVEAGGAGGGVAELQVRNSSDTWTDVGYYTGNMNIPTQDAAGQAPGSAAPSWAIQIGGSSYGGSPTTQVAKVDSSGNVYVDVTNTVGVSGTVTANAGTGNFNITSQGAGNMAVGQVSVTSTATQIVAARATRNTVAITNLGTIPIYLGGSGVTTSTGLLLLGMTGAYVSIPATTAIYGITSSTSQSVSYMDLYN